MKTLDIAKLVLAGSFLIAGSAAIAQTQGQSAPPPAPANTAAPAAMEVPAGTEIAVRNNDAINSTEASEGQTYSAVVVDDVRDNSGQVLIPKDSDAQLVVRNASSGGTTGSSELTLALHSVTVNGRRYLVNTEDVTQKGQQGIGKNKRTGEMVGGGAVLGTLLGAIAGGGKGAAIGAVAGATAGGATQVLTRGKRVSVPAETVLRFQLNQPLELSSTD
jgi:hypothetical protein